VALHQSEAVTIKGQFGIDRRAIGVERVDLRIALVALATVFYSITFVPLYRALGPGIVSLGVVPVALTGWLFGLRRGRRGRRGRGGWRGRLSRACRGHQQQDRPDDR